MSLSPALVIGIAIGVGTLTIIKRSSVFGIECFHTTKEFLPTTTCLSPAIFYGLLGVAALLTIVGVISMVKGSPK